MLKSSFIHIPGVGIRTERRIWAAGTHTLNQFHSAPPSFLSSGQTDRIMNQVERSIQCLSTGDTDYFYKGLSACDSWRMFREFKGSVAYLDIETTGLGAPGDIITSIALYDGSEVFTYVHGDNLDSFPDDIIRYSVLVTYNGKTFDVPFIERYFGISLSFMAHLDLRYILRSLGISGGLKSCERQMGLGRTGALAQVDGYFAVLLWNEFRRTGDRAVLETLVSYNVQDTINLEHLMVEAYNRKLQTLPIEIPPIGIPAGFLNPWRVHPEVVHRLQSSPSRGYSPWS